MNNPISRMIDGTVSVCDVSDTTQMLCEKAMAFFEEHGKAGIAQTSNGKSALALEFACQLGALHSKAHTPEAKLVHGVYELLRQDSAGFPNVISPMKSTPKIRLQRAMHFFGVAISLVHSQNVQKDTKAHFGKLMATA